MKTDPCGSQNIEKRSEFYNGAMDTTNYNCLGVCALRLATTMILLFVFTGYKVLVIKCPLDVILKWLIMILLTLVFMEI